MILSIRELFARVDENELCKGALFPEKAFED
jgi:hypothetical protein